MSGDLYEQDALIWSEQQAELLRRLSLGERVNDRIDWPNVIEELRDVGLSQLNAVSSLLYQALVHLLKMRGWPAGPVAHWRSETRTFLSDARRRFTPSMRQRIDLAALYEDAVIQVRGDEHDGRPPADLPDHCALTLDDLLAARPDPTDLARAIGGPAR